MLNSGVENYLELKLFVTNFTFEISALRKYECCFAECSWKTIMTGIISYNFYTKIDIHRFVYVA